MHLLTVADGLYFCSLVTRLQKYQPSELQNLSVGGQGLHWSASTAAVLLVVFSRLAVDVIRFGFGPVGYLQLPRLKFQPPHFGS